MRTEDLLANLSSPQSSQMTGGGGAIEIRPPHGRPHPKEIPKFEVVDEASDHDERSSSRKVAQGVVAVLKDVVVAFVIILLIISSLFLYTGNWPPLVVVKSESMMHGTDSEVGVIDTGDMVLVKEVDSTDDIITYVTGEKREYSTYGNYGDVIIYDKNGRGGTPVIHRAIVWVEYNTTGQGFDVPEMDLWNVFSITLPHFRNWSENTTKTYGTPVIDNFVIDLTRVKNNIDRDKTLFSLTEGFSGYLTMGDFNPGCDQEYALMDSNGTPVGPVDIDWVIGKGRGELPWFGLIKLWVDKTFRDEGDDNQTPMPRSSVRNLWIVIFVLIGGTVAIDVTLYHLEKRKKEKGDTVKFNETEEEPKRKTPTPEAKTWDHGQRTGRPPDIEMPTRYQSHQPLSKDELLRGFKK